MSQQKGCPTCTHVEGITGKCKAFPNGIPVVFTSGQFLHDKVVEGQVGDFVYQKAPQQTYQVYRVPQE